MVLSMQRWFGIWQPVMPLLAALTMASHFSVVMSPCQRYSPGLNGCQVGNVRDDLCCGFTLRIGVLHLQKNLHLRVVAHED